MKKIKFLNTLIAVMFMAVALAACSSSSKDDDDDDDDDDERTEKIDRKSREKSDDFYDDDNYYDEEETPISNSSNTVDSFCSLLSDMTRAIAQASSEQDLRNMSGRFESRAKRFDNDNTPLTSTDKEKIISALVLFVGTTMDKGVELSGEDIDETELYNVGYTMGQQLRQMVEDSRTLGEVCENLDHIFD